MTNDERRRYFRIDDSMGVSYNLLGKEEAKVFAQQSREQGGNFDLASNFDNRIQTLLDTCKLQAPIAAELIDLINKKLNFVLAQLDMDMELMQKVAYSLRQVNVSACGMAFNNENAMDVGQMLQLDILLHPAELHIVAMAEVVACGSLEEDQIENDCCYFLRLNFVEINATDQELLIQHIVKRQGLILKQLRRDREQESEPGTS